MIKPITRLSDSETNMAPRIVVEFVQKGSQTGSFKIDSTRDIWNDGVGWVTGSEEFDLSSALT